MDLFEKLQKNRGPLGQHAAYAHGYFMFPKLEGDIGPRMKFRGKEMLNWSLNNYIGLANHPEVRKADTEYAAKYGFSAPMGARMMSGNTNLHEQLEAELSDYVGKQDTLLMNFGYQGIMSAIDALLDRHDVAIYDSESHASIVDGVRLHMGKRFVFPHNDIDNLEKQLQRATKIVEETGGAILVITEGVFGMAADLGKLDKIVELKKKYQFRLLVDDAHGFGIMGKTGAGTHEHFNVVNDVDLYFSTFAKSVALIGAFISGDEQVIEFLRYNTRSQIFAKALPLPLVGGALKRLELMRKHPEYREQVWTIVSALQKGFRDNGFNLGRSETPVTSVILQGDGFQAANLLIDLRENFSIFCSMVIYPVVPKDVIMLRIIPTAAHTLADVEETISAFKQIVVKLKEGKYDKKITENPINM